MQQAAGEKQHVFLFKVFGVSLTGWTLANLESGPDSASPRLGQGKGSPQPLACGCVKGDRTGSTSGQQGGSHESTTAQTPAECIFP